MENEKLDAQFLKRLAEEGYSSYLVSDLGYGGNKKKMFTNEPDPLFSPYRWGYEKTKDLLYTLTSMVSPEEAERVNVQFEHPDLRPYLPGATTTTMRSGMQMVKQGQFAPEHMHSARSFRIVLKGPEEGAYTTANGVDLPLRKGDIVLNPDWVWHSHRNLGNEDVIWFNGMDVIMAYWMGGVFYKDSKNKKVSSGSSIDTHLKKWGQPTFTYVNKKLEPGSLLYYPREYTIDSLIEIGESEKDHSEVIRRIINPRNAGPLFPTLDVKFWYIPPEGQSAEYQRTENIVFLNYSGEGSINVEGKRYEFGQFDVVAIPSWKKFSISNKSHNSMIALSYSDRPMFEAMGLYREGL